MGGSLKDVQPVTLAETCIKGILDRTHIDPKEIGEVVLGHCRQSSAQPEYSPYSRSALRNNRGGTRLHGNASMRFRPLCRKQCSYVHSDRVNMTLFLPAVLRACQTQYSMFAAPVTAFGTGTTQFIDSLTEGQFQSQPQEIYGTFNMGVTAENVAERMNISREDQDIFSLESQVRASKAIAEGKFKDEIIPVVIPQRKGDPIIFRHRRISPSDIAGEARESFHLRSRRMAARSRPATPRKERRSIGSAYNVC
jgi:acetyl-CoA C-acetyltransferase